MHSFHIIAPSSANLNLGISVTLREISIVQIHDSIIENAVKGLWDMSSVE